MTDAKRNDPCPCGSGKKYKKCCWEKDQSKRTPHRGGLLGRSLGFGKAGAHGKELLKRVQVVSQASARTPSVFERATHTEELPGESSEQGK